MEEQKGEKKVLIGHAIVSLNPVLFLFPVKDNVAVVGKGARAGTMPVRFQLTDLYDEDGAKVEPESAMDPRLKDFMGCTAHFDLKFGNLKLAGTTAAAYSYKWIDGRVLKAQSAVAKVVLDESTVEFLKLGLDISVFGDASGNRRTVDNTEGVNTVLEVAAAGSSQSDAVGGVERRTSARVAELRSKLQAAKTSLAAVQTSDSRSCLLQ